MRVIPFRRVRKTNKASLRARDRYRYFTREFAAAACQKTSIAPGSKERRCADDHHRRFTRAGGRLCQYSTPSPWSG